MRTFAKAGWNAQQINQAIFASANMASIGEMSLADSAKFTATVLKAYQWEAKRAGDATSLIAFFSNKSVYAMSDLQTIMGKVGATAHAYGQDMAQTLQLATAFGQVGVAPSEAATMMRQLYIKASNPDVSSFLEASLQHQGLKALYSEDTGKMTNVGQAYVAAAQSIQEYSDSLSGAEKAEFGMMRDQAIYSMFGIRQARSFMSLASLDIKKFNEIMPDTLKATLEKAHKYEEGYMAKLRTDFHWAVVQAQATREALGTTMGGPGLSIARPFLQAGTEVMAFANDLILSNDTMKQLVPSVFFMTGAIVGLTGVVALSAGVFMLIRTRLADVGTEIMESTVAMNKLKKSYGSWQVMQWKNSGMKSTIGTKYLTSYATGTLRMLTSLAGIGAVIYYAWTKNLAGIQDMTKKFFSGWNEKLNMTGTLGETIANKFKNIFSPYRQTAYGHTGTMFGSMLSGAGGEFNKGGMFEGLLSMLITSLKVAAGIFNALILTPLKWVGRAFGTILYAIARITGAGDVAKGFERLGKALGWIISLTVFEKLIKNIYALGKSLTWLTGYVFFHGGWGGVARTASMKEMVGTMWHHSALAETYRGGQAVYGYGARKVRGARGFYGDYKAAGESVIAQEAYNRRHNYFVKKDVPRRDELMAINKTLSVAKKSGLSKAELDVLATREVTAFYRKGAFGRAARGSYSSAARFLNPVVSPDVAGIGASRFKGLSSQAQGYSLGAAPYSTMLLKNILPVLLVTLMAAGTFALIYGAIQRRRDNAVERSRVNANLATAASRNPINVTTNVTGDYKDPKAVGDAVASSVKDVLAEQEALKFEYEQRMNLEAGI